MAGFSNSLVNGQTEGSVALGIIEHVKIRCRSQKCFWGCLVSIVFFLFFNDNPLGFSSEWVGFELKHSLGQPAGGGGGAHASGCGGATGKC